jgi:di/tricarboxylate transporter
MNLGLAVVLILLAAAVAMFAINKPRMDVVAVIMLVALPLTGTVSMGEALSGFSDSNIVLIAALFVLGDGLVRTGVAQRLGDLLIAQAGSSPTRLLVLLMIAVAGMGAVMSSTGVVAIFIPIVLRIARNTGTPPSQLMMPLSFAALISGMMTLVATAPNLVVNAELIRMGSAGFQFFSFTPFGVPILILGILYMIFARRLLGGSDGTSSFGVPLGPSLSDWVERYSLGDREYRERIRNGSLLVGKTLRELDLPRVEGANILAIERAGRFSNELVQPLPATDLRAGDVLLVDMAAPIADGRNLRDKYGLEEMPLSGAYFADLAQEIGMAEIVIPPESSLTGKSVAELKFRDSYGLTVIGIRRGRVALDREGMSTSLKVGDTLLVIGPWRNIRALQSEREDLFVLNLPSELGDVLPAASRAPFALACLVLTVGLMVSGLVTNVHAALIGCLLMGASRCIDMTSAYRSIHWQTLLLIVGMLPFSTALQRTGGVDLAADGLLAVVGGSGIHVVLACLFGVTAVLGLFISNTATAVLMTPVALALAADLHSSPYPFAMTVALGASAAFMTPVSSPVNTLVVTPGNYAFADFLRVGVPFTVVVMIVSVLLVPLILPP